MEITWKSQRRGQFTNYVATINGQRVAVYQPTKGAEWVVSVDFNELPGKFPTAAAARKAWSK